MQRQRDSKDPGNSQPTYEKKVVGIDEVGQHVGKLVTPNFPTEDLIAEVNVGMLKPQLEKWIKDVTLITDQGSEVIDLQEVYKIINKIFGLKLLP